MDKKLISYIGLAQRANDVIYGEDQIKEKLKLVKVILVDSNAPDKFKERVLAKFSNQQIFVIENLQQALHKDNVNIVGIKNEELSKVINNLLR